VQVVGDVSDRHVCVCVCVCVCVVDAILVLAGALVHISLPMKICVP